MSKTVKERLEQLRTRLPENSQKGFTLIELLVVVSILGILAAVVTLSLVGVQKVAQDRAQAAELSTVQAAFDTDVQQNEAPTGSAVPTDLKAACDALNQNPSNDFSTFPATQPLYPNYLHTKTSQWTYYCADDTSGKLGSR